MVLIMKKLLAAAALGALTLSAPAHAQSAPNVPSVIGGGLTTGAAVAIGFAIVFVAAIVSDDNDSTSTTATN